MTRILVVEDDPSVRELVRLHLESAGHEVRIAEGGAAALRLARLERFDLVVSEVRVSGLDGFGLLAALRADPATADIPLVFVTVQDDRETFRMAMNLGADDFIGKPVVGEELVLAVQARLARAQALRERGGRTVADSAVHVNSEAPTVRMPLAPELPTSPLPIPPSGAALPTSPLAVSDDSSGPHRRELSREPRAGTLFWVAVRNGAAMAYGFSAQERRDVLQSFFSALCEPILAQHGYVIRHNARELVAAFEGDAERGTDHASRAMRAALLTVLAVSHFREALMQRARGGARPEFSIGIALDSGAYDLVTTEGDYGQETNVEGLMAHALAHVDGSVAAAGWTVAATDVTVRSAGPDFAVGRAAALAPVADAPPMMLLEVTGFDPKLGTQSGFAPVYQAVEEAVRFNSRLAEQSADPAVAAGVFAIPSAPVAEPAPPAEVVGIPGYTVIRKLGSGGMSRVYLARHEESGGEQVLKVVPFAEDDEDMLQRFIQEYALIAQVRHPNVARIYGQGFAEACAYIAMEYLSGGDLRDRIAHGIAYADAVRYLTQTALALTAIHERGIVHRDLKPENLMLRGDGALVLADFGIAKQLSTALTRTRHGEVYGTPFYMSPEQARGDPVDGRSDLYALGVIFHEMLTGAKPFTATRAEALVYQHLHSDIPTLPGKFWRVQPILDRLLAKDPKDRFPSALELLRSLRELPDVAAEPLTSQAAASA